MVDQMVLGVLASYFIEYLKSTRYFSLLSYLDTGAYKAFFSALVAFLVTLGFHYTFENQKLIIDIPTQAQLGHAAWMFVRQWVFQHVSFMALIKPREERAFINGTPIS
jgi:hypothetical protein